MSSSEYGEVSRGSGGFDAPSEGGLGLKWGHTDWRADGEAEWEQSVGGAAGREHQHTEEEGEVWKHPLSVHKKRVNARPTKRLRTTLRPTHTSASASSASSSSSAASSESAPSMSSSASASASSSTSTSTTTSASASATASGSEPGSEWQNGVARAVMQSWGWAQGKGLGAREQGRAEPIVGAVRRVERGGLGFGDTTTQQKAAVPPTQSASAAASTPIGSVTPHTAPPRRPLPPHKQLLALEAREQQIARARARRYAALHPSESVQDSSDEAARDSELHADWVSAQRLAPYESEARAISTVYDPMYSRAREAVAAAQHKEANPTTHCPGSFKIE